MTIRQACTALPYIFFRCSLGCKAWSWNLRGSSTHEPLRTPLYCLNVPEAVSWGDLDRKYRCVVPARAQLYAGDCCIIFGACNSAEATGLGLAAPRDTLCTVSPCAPTLLSVLLWQPLSQQHWQSQAVLIALPPEYPSDPTPELSSKLFPGGVR